MGLCEYFEKRPQRKPRSHELGQQPYLPPSLPIKWCTHPHSRVTKQDAMRPNINHNPLACEGDFENKCEVPEAKRYDT